MLKYESKKIDAEFIGETWTKISLHLEDVNPGIANGLRRIALLDLEKVAITMDIESLESDDTEIRKLFSDIQLNISLIRTTLPEGVDLIINEKNTTNEPRFITSNDFKLLQKDGKDNLLNNIQKNIKICSLARNCSIKLQAKTEKKSGFYGPQYIPCRDIGYKVTDYVDIDLINYSGNIEEAMVSRTSLEKLLKSENTKNTKNTKTTKNTKKTKKDIYDQKILVCPDKLYLDKMEKEIRDDFDDFYSYYDHVIINDKTNDGSIPDTAFSEKYITKFSSTEAMPRDFRLKFMIYYEVDPVEFLKSLFTKFIQKLESLTNIPNKVVTELVKLDQNGIIYTLRKNLIYDENETVANILRYAIYGLSPEIPFLNMEKSHKIDNMIYLNFISESDELLPKSINKSISILENLRKQIS